MGWPASTSLTGHARHFCAACSVLFVIGVSSPQAAGAAYVYQAKWGGSGAGEGEFSLPSGLAVDSLDNVYVGNVSSVVRINFVVLR